MLYEQYRNKVIKFAGFLKVLKKFRILIISIVAVLLCTAACLLSICGMVYNVDDCPQVVEYGQEVEYSANAIFKDVWYEYSDGNGEWTTVQPKRAGNYLVRAVSNNVFGGNRYGNQYAFTIAPKAITVKIDQSSIRYGDDPAVCADLSYSDSVQCTQFIYEDIGARSTSVTPDKESIVITDENGNDVTSSYIINIEKGIIDFEQREVSITVGSKTGIYDGLPLGFDSYELNKDTPLAENDSIIAVFDDFVTDAGQIANEPEIRVYRDLVDGKVEVTGNYKINLVPGTLTVEKRPVYVSSGNAEMVYDGTGLSSKEFTLISQTDLIEGHTLQAVGSTVAITAGETENILEFRIVDKEGKDLTDNYSVFLNPGTLKVLQRKITVLSEDCEFEYDGEAHSHEIHSIKEGEYMLLDGHSTTAYDLATITDVGTAENKLSVKILDGKGEDVTDNYTIGYEYGALSVTPRPITVTSLSCEWEYDGAAHSYGGHTVNENGLVKEHKSEAYDLATITNVNADIVKNVLSVKVFDGDREVTGNYKIGYEYGELNITPRPITVTAGSSTMVYDGTALTCETYSVSSAKQLVEGHTISAQTQGSQTDVGNGDNKIIEDSVQIKDGEDDVTYNYNITCEKGTLNITPRPITVTADSSTKVYDGMPLTCGTFTVTSQLKLVEGHTISAWTYGGRTNVGEGDNAIVEGSVVIKDGERDVTGNYEITCAIGTLTVTPKPITVTSLNYEWEYDGVAHSYGGHTVNENGLVSVSHTTLAFKLATITNVGTVDNSLLVYVYDGYRNVTDNYDISYEYGELSVTPRPITVKAGSDAKIYDGTPLTCNTVEVSSAKQLIEGQSISAQTQGSRTDVGTADNAVVEGTVAITDGTEDVTYNYTFAYEKGTLTVLQRPITVEAGSSEKFYDGTALTCETVMVTSQLKLVEGHTISAQTDGSRTDVGYADNTVVEGTVVITDGERDVTFNYDISYATGTLTVNPRPITVVSDNATKYYDGTPLTCDEFSIISAHQPPLVLDHVARVEITGSQTQVGESKNVISSVKIFSGENDVSYNYDPTTLEGMLTVRIAGELVIETSGAEKVYDGLELRNPEYTVITNTLGEGFEFVYDVMVECTGTITDVGSVDNGCIVTVSSEDVDLTKYADISVTYGTLTVIPRPITVTTGSDSWEYDGKSHKCEEYTLQDGVYDGVSYGILEGHTLTVDNYNQITQVGTVHNTADIVITAIVDGKEIDVTKKYTVNSNYGELTVTEKVDNGSGEDKKGGNLDTGGIISGGGSGGSGSGKTVVFKVFSQSTGTVYFRLLSYGNYSGKSWGVATEYGKMIDDTYCANYLTGLALENAGYAKDNITIESYSDDYLLPYFMAISSEGDKSNYVVQTDDVWYKGVYDTQYSLNFYMYDYLTGGKVEVGSEYKLYEQAYGSFVKANYLEVKDSAKGYLQSLISDNGFSADDPDIIEKVAKFIQGSAEYNLQYDSSLDMQEDIVVAFLRDYKEGICQHYASAATLLYRALGIPARYTIGYVGKTSAGEWTEVTSMNAHAWVEVYIDGMGWVNVEVTGAGGAFGGGGNGGGSGSSGGSEMEITVKPVDKVKVYDGTALVPDSFEGADSDSALLLNKLRAQGYTFEVTYSGTITEIGVAESRIESIIAYNSAGAKVSTIEFKFASGSLTVLNENVKLITVYPYVLQKYYDGTPLAYSEGDYYVEGLPTGWRLDLSLAGISMTEAGVLRAETVESLPIAVYDENGDLVGKENYCITFGVTDFITIDKRIITIATGSAYKVYDGTPLINEDFWVSGGSLAEGHVLEVELVGTITDIGKVTNKVTSLVIRDADGNDVTKNYSITLNEGTLEVISD